MRVLEEALESFAGCVVVISHDRWLLDRITTHMLAFEGDSRVVWFEGNYSEYEADRKVREDWFTGLISLAKPSLLNRFLSAHRIRMAGWLVAGHVQ